VSDRFSEGRTNHASGRFGTVTDPNLSGVLSFSFSPPQDEKTSSDEAWEAVKTGAEKAWTEVKTAYDDATSKFK
jgi:hypothetical protein